MSLHSYSDIQSTSIGQETRIWQFCVVLPRAVIGAKCNICSHVFIENDVRIGDRVTIKNGVQLWDGITIEDDVFIGPNVTFSNDAFPRSRNYPTNYARTIVRRGASIGANATILPGLVIGEHSMVGAGAVVTRDVPSYSIVVGNPARITAYVDTEKTHRLASTTKTGSLQVHEVSELAGCSLHSLTEIEDLRGKLSLVEFHKDVPFEAKRCFWVYGVPSREVRGEHAHLKCHQFLISMAGSVQLILDDGKQRVQVSLDRSSLGVHIPPLIWAVQYRYTEDAVLAVFASHGYDPKDYIRDYRTFLRHIQEKKST